MSHKKIAIITSKAPHGSASAREGLDAVLAVSAYCDEIALFFIGDGVLQLVKNQQAELCLQRQILPTFGMLELYDIEPLYLCKDSLAERGIDQEQLSINVTLQSRSEIAEQLRQFDHHLHF